jgi:hypothetical protein
MNRCVRAAVLAASLSSLLSLALPAAAQVHQGHRHFPAHALRGELVVGAPPEVTLNGKPERLAPGARIRGEDNLIHTGATLAGQRFIVHYTREPGSGLLMDVWLLKPMERDNKPWPSTEREAKAWVFDPLSQIWKKP